MDVLLLAGAYETKSGRNKSKQKRSEASSTLPNGGELETPHTDVERYREVFDGADVDGSGSLDMSELSALMKRLESDREKQCDELGATERRANYLIVVGRVRTGVEPSINLSAVLEEFGGGGHAKAASVTVRLKTADRPHRDFYDAQNGSTEDEDEVAGVLSAMMARIKDQISQPVLTVADCMTCPVLCCNSTTTISAANEALIVHKLESMPVREYENFQLRKCSPHQWCVHDHSAGS
jgi:hypothetical protein